MKMGTQRRDIFHDAVDLLTDVPVSSPAQDGQEIKMLEIDEIEPFKDHPFRLYEGERLDDMTDSIKAHGILVPVIVRKRNTGGYEMLSGHNRQKAGKLAGLKTLPAIIKTNLSDKDAYVYVIETNLIQRSFSELLPSEKAAVLEERYEKISDQGRRNDIIRELEVLSGNKQDSTLGQVGQKLRGREVVGKEYGLSSRVVARLMPPVAKVMEKPYTDIIS